MESSKTIAHEIGGIQNDALRFGLQGVKSDLVGSHPVESLYETVISFPSLSIAILYNVEKWTGSFNLSCPI